MSTEVQVNVTVSGGDKAAKEISKVSKGSNELVASTDQATGALDKMTGGAVSGFKTMVGGLKKVVLGMKTFKGAMISTGIGALVIAVGSLVSYFTQTQRGAEMLEVATASLGAVFDVLTDTLSSLGESIMSVFTDPKQAMQDFGDSLKKFVTDKIAAVTKLFGILGGVVKDVLDGEFGDAMDGAKEAAKLYATEISITGQIIVKATEAAGDLSEGAKALALEMEIAAKKGQALAKASIQLRKDQRNLSKEFAEGRAQIKEYNFIAEDVNATLEVRLEAAQKAIDIEKELMTERQRIATEEVRIQKERMAMSESTEEDQQRLVDLEVALINIRTESAEMQTTLNNKLNIIKQQATAESIAAAQAEQDLLTAQEAAMQAILAKTQTAEQNEQDAAMRKYDALFLMAYEHGIDTAELLEAQQEEQAAIYKKYRDQNTDETIESIDETVDARIKGAQMAIQVTQAFAGFMQTQNKQNEEQSEKEQRAAFKRAKALQIAGAVMSTASAVISALAAPPVGLGPTPAGFAASAVAAFSGAAQIATIRQQEFSQMGGATDSPDAAVFTRALVPDNLPMSDTTPTLNSQGGEPPLRAYVVSTEMTNQQQLDNQLSHRSVL